MTMSDIKLMILRGCDIPSVMYELLCPDIERAPPCTTSFILLVVLKSTVAVLAENSDPHANPAHAV